MRKLAYLPGNRDYSLNNMKDTVKGALLTFDFGNKEKCYVLENSISYLKNMLEDLFFHLHSLDWCAFSTCSKEILY